VPDVAGMSAPATHDDDSLADLVAVSLREMQQSTDLVLEAVAMLDATVPASSVARDQVTTLQHEARRLAHDLVHLLGLLEFERRQAAPHAQVVDCERLLAEVAAVNAGLLAQRGIQLSTTCRDAIEGYFDRTLVLGVLNSVVNNAYRHARSRVDIACEVQDGYTVLSVTDDGVGYAPRLLGHDVRTVGASNFHSGNTGLGLFFARRVAALHEHRGRHGQVVLRTQDGDGGGRFELWLP
jgi:two-component system sensor histidine kinase SenX3